MRPKGRHNGHPHEQQEDGPDVWRRSVYIYQRRSLPYPMFETFDHPDMNLTAAARNVSTVPTQALTLLNNPFVLREAELLADGGPGQADRSRLSVRARTARHGTREEACAREGEGRFSG